MRERQTGFIGAKAVAHRLEVMAEGVATEDQRDFLANTGCDQFQRYLFSPAVRGKRSRETP